MLKGFVGGEANVTIAAKRQKECATVSEMSEGGNKTFYLGYFGD